VECAFGRLKSKYRILHCNDKFNDAVMFPALIKVLCALHNFLSREEGREEPTCRGSWCTPEEEDVCKNDMLFVNPTVARTAAQDNAHDMVGATIRDRLCRHLELSKMYGLSRAAEEVILLDKASLLCWLGCSSHPFFYRLSMRSTGLYSLSHDGRLLHVPTCCKHQTTASKL
jgi:hypothetical protein